MGVKPVPGALCHGMGLVKSCTGCQLRAGKARPFSSRWRIQRQFGVKAMKRKFIIHIGPAKTGTSSLQEVLFEHRDTLLANTEQFAKGLPANNALLWGARGMGKSSLVKAIHGAVQASHEDLRMVELQREDLPSVGRLLNVLRGVPHRFILFCDDLSFGHDDAHYKSLKAVLDGGIEGRPDNVVLYATSNRRHLMPLDMI